MDQEKKSRKKGIPVPQASINEAIGYIRKVSDIVGDRAMSFDETMGHMGVSKAYGKVFVKVFKDYGLMEQIKGGFWKISPLGIKCLNGEYNAIKDAFERITLFKQLMEVFGKGKFTSKAVSDYLKNKYHKPENYVKNAAEKFWAGKEYLEKVERGTETTKELEMPLDTTDIRKTLKIILLQYAFNPPSSNEIENLIEEVYEEFQDDRDSGIRTLVKSMKENKKDDKNRRLLFNNFLTIISERYPALLKEKKSKE
jgi:hypothetical protein